jgi:hypothetical protein
MARLQLIGCGGARDEVRLRPLAERATTAATYRPLPRRRLIVILVPGVQAINIALSTAGAVVTWVTYRQILCLVGLAAIGGVSLSP